MHYQDSAKCSVHQTFCSRRANHGPRLLRAAHHAFRSASDGTSTAVLLGKNCCYSYSPDMETEAKAGDRERQPTVPSTSACRPQATCPRALTCSGTRSPSRLCPFYGGGNGSRSSLMTSQGCTPHPCWSCDLNEGWPWGVGPDPSWA